MLVTIQMRKRNNCTASADFPTGVELADDTTALLIYYLLTDVVAWPTATPATPTIVCWFFCAVTQQTATFWNQGPMMPKFELRQDFCTMHLTIKFHHPTFNRSEVILLTNKLTNKLRNWQTNKQTPLKTCTSLSYATPMGKNGGKMAYTYYETTN